MKLYLYNHNMRYAVEQILLSLFPGERPEYPQDKPKGDRAEIALHEGEAFYTAVCSLTLGGITFRGSSRAAKAVITDDLIKARYLQRAVKLAFYRAAIKSGKTVPVWGSLTGIRPGKRMLGLIESGLSDRAALGKFMRDNDVSPERAKLCLQTAHAGLACEQSLEKNHICLYVGIPFCPTRCSYCSFVSQAVQKSMKQIPRYLEALCLEIEATGKVVTELSLCPISLYLGGGTPTTLSAQQLDHLFSALKKAFDFSTIREITVEAGRPDTITEEKLLVLKSHGVTRLSVNPQTMNDDVLEAIGRKHTAGDIITALELVRKVGGFDTNMDLIAGLPKDSPESFENTLKTVLSLSPENITVHTLALKKGSEIMLGDTPRPTAAEVEKMVNSANNMLSAAEYVPYYLYRQKYMSGGLENVGWQRGNTENIYNICIMEELCSIISMGSAGSTKLCLDKGRIERIFNPKFPQEYISGIEKIIDEKGKIKELLSCHIV